MAPESTPEVDLGRIPGRRSRGALLAALFVLVALGSLVWQVRPEAWRQRIESGLSSALKRPVQLAAVSVVWPDHVAGDTTRPVLVLQIDGLAVPAHHRAREWRVGMVEVTLQRDVAAWWRAWRGQLPWPVQAVTCRELQSTPPVDPDADGYGRWSLAVLELQDLRAVPDVPRVASIRFRGSWQRTDGAAPAPAVPVAGELRDLAVSLPLNGSAPGLSMDSATLDFGGLPLRFEAVVADAISATFTMTLGPVNLRQILPTLGIAVPETTDPATFTRVNGRADCHRDALGLGCSGLVLQMDDTRFEGEASQSGLANLAGRPPAPWRLRLTADRLDLDRYLPPEDPAEPPFEIPWTLADAWPIEAELTVGDLRLAGLRLRHAKVSLQAGERGWVTR